MHAHVIDERVGDERRPAADELEEHAAERVDVRAVVDVLGAAELLRRHVRGGAERGSGPGLHRARIVDQFGDAEVEDLGANPEELIGTMKMFSGLMSRWMIC